MTGDETEDGLLRDAALKNAASILLARRRAEDTLSRTQSELRQTNALLVAEKETLRESEARFRATFEQAATGIAIAALDGTFLELNDKFCSIVGYRRDELKGKTFLDITHDDDKPATRREVERLMSGEVPNYVMEKRYVRADGRPVWSMSTVTLLRDEHKRPQRFIGVIEDITQRKLADEKIRRSEEELRALAHSLQEETRILELLNSTGTTLASNLDLQTLLQAITDAATKLSGARFGAFFYNTTGAGGDAYLLYTLSGAPREAFERFGQLRATQIFAPTFNGQGVIRLDNVRVDPRYGKMAPHYGMPPGHLPVCSYLAVPVASRSGGVLGGLFFGHGEPGVFTARHERIIVGIAAQASIAIDNAQLYERSQQAAEERTRLLESERAARADAERASALKDEFLATLSHELRTPLSAILGWSQVLRRGARDETTLLRGLDTIERNARAQTQLIEDLLDMSRITSGKLHLDIQPVDPVTFIEAAMETMRPAADAKGVRLEKMLDPHTGPVAGDPGRLQQVVWNLLSNAIKFTARGGKVQILLERVNSNVEINISDTGIGIGESFLPHVFERFRQGNQSITRSAGGLGLGLSIVKHLIELHGGSVHAKSPGENMGSTFTLTLPSMVVHKATTATERWHPRTPVAISTDFQFADLAGIKVLVVDDEPDARELIKQVLGECNANVIVASGASEALALVQSELPDVLVSDIGMPETDGYTLLGRVRALGAAAGGNVPAIALTAFARSEDRTRALRAGFLVHVSKPVEPEELVATVASVAGRTGPKASY